MRNLAGLKTNHFIWYFRCKKCLFLRFLNFCHNSRFLSLFVLEWSPPLSPMTSKISFRLLNSNTISFPFLFFPNAISPFGPFFWFLFDPFRMQRYFLFQRDFRKKMNDDEMIIFGTFLGIFETVLDKKNYNNLNFWRENEGFLGTSLETLGRQENWHHHPKIGTRPGDQKFKYNFQKFVKITKT